MRSDWFAVRRYARHATLLHLQRSPTETRHLLLATRCTVGATEGGLSGAAGASDSGPEQQRGRYFGPAMLIFGARRVTRKGAKKAPVFMEMDQYFHSGRPGLGPARLSRR